MTVGELLVRMSSAEIAEWRSLALIRQQEADLASVRK